MRERMTEAGTVETTILEDVGKNGRAGVTIIGIATEAGIVETNGTEEIPELTESVLAKLDVELTESVDDLIISEPTAPKPPCPDTKQAT